MTLAEYLRWWLDVDLVEQVEDRLIGDTTRSSYVTPITGHVMEPLGSVRLHVERPANLAAQAAAQAGSRPSRVCLRRYS